MPPALFPVSIQIDQNSLTQAMLQGLVDHLKTILGKPYEEACKARIGAEATRLVRASAEYAYLHVGELRGQMGLEFPSQAIEDVLEGLVKAILVTADGPRLVGQSFVGGVEASILRVDLQELLSRDGASYRSGGHDVQWLSWMLTEGDRVVVQDYAFLGNPTSGGIRKGSRTLLGIMRKAKKTPGWNVPEALRGTVTANWFTRALFAIENFMGDVMVDELRRRF